jgi:hypothetical protein
MKTNRILLAIASLTGTAAVLSCALGICFPQVAHAESAEALGTWEGTGVVTEAGNKDPSAFTIVVTRTAQGAGVVRTDGKLQTASGKEIVFWQEKTERGEGAFTLVTNRGTGGGCCFVNGMCQSLEHTDNGHGLASTMVLDGPQRVRLLVTELENGKAIRFYAQTLVKKQ